MNNIYATLDYRTIIENNIKYYLEEYGRLKFDKVLKKIQNSKKIASLLALSYSKSFIPNNKDFLYSLNEIPFFIFSKPETLKIAGLLSLERWNQECNPENSLGNDDKLKEIALAIIEDCKRLKFKR